MQALVFAFQEAIQTPDQGESTLVRYITARDALLTAIAALEAQVDRERQSNAVLIRAGNDLEAVSTANGIDMERWFAYRNHWRIAIAEHSSPSPTGP